MSLQEQIDPTEGKLLVRREPSPSTVGGLALPDRIQSLRRSSRGVILKAGKGVHPAFEPGRRVVTDPTGGAYVSSLGTDKEELVILAPVDILAFIGPDE